MSDATIDVSIIVPTFNRVDLAFRAISSATTQVGVRTEVIVVDDSDCTDASQAIFKFSKHVGARYLVGTRTGNAVENWNFGIECGRGAFYALLHQDEFYLTNNSVSTLFEAARSARKDVAIGSTRVIGIDRSSKFNLIHPFATRFASWQDLLILNWLGPSGCMLIGRECELRFDSSLKSLVDVEFYIRLLRSASVCFVGTQPLVGSIGHHGGQISADADIAEKTYNELFTLYNAYSTEMSLSRRLATKLRMMRLRPRARSKPGNTA